LTAFEQVHSVTPAEDAAGQSPSDWVLMSRKRTDLEPLVAAGGWTMLIGSSASPAWTDDFSNILAVLKLR
jgi:hypothetical protein